MNYYLLNHSVEGKIVGTQYPQIQKMIKGYDMKAPDAIRTLENCYEELPTFTPNLNAFQLHARAKPTDLVSSVFGPFGIIVSEKLKLILEQHNLSKHTFFKATLQHKIKSYDNYYWMHIIPDYLDYVDYPNSNFIIELPLSQNLGAVKISSKADWFEKKEKVKNDNPSKTIYISAKKIKFLPEFYKLDLDFFEVARLTSRPIISSHLADALRQNNITGIEIHDAPM